MSLPRIPLRIRPAGDHDVPTLVAFNRAMAAETETKALDPARLERGVRGLLARPEAGFYLVAEADGGVLGSLLVTPEWTDWRDGWFWWIQSVYVAPDARGQGVYRALHEEVARRARETGGVRGLRLYVERGNEVARRVYEHLGMSETAYRLYEVLLP
jgi:GNAT superfamily N-acetyltransferase